MLASNTIPYDIPSNQDLEKSLIKKNMLTTMSSDARFVLRSTINNAGEILLVTAPTQQKLTYRVLYLFLLRKLHWHQQRIKKAFTEIENYLNE